MSWLAKRRERKTNEAAAQRADARRRYEELGQQRIAGELAWKALIEVAASGDRAAFMAQWEKCPYEGLDRLVGLALMCGRNSINQNKE